MNLEESLSLLSSACISGQDEVVYKLIDDNLALWKRLNSLNKAYLLTAVAKSNNDGIVCTLLDNGADIDCTDEDDDIGRSYLHFAIQKKNYSSVDLLLKRGANAEISDKEGNTPLLVATRLGDNDAVELLLAGGANKERSNDRGIYDGTPLIMASYYGHLHVAQALIRAGARLDARINTGLTALHMASGYGHVDIINLLLDHGADIEAQNYSGRTSLSSASICGFPLAAQQLLSRGADVHARSLDGGTALHWAAANGKFEVVAVLMGAGADVNSRNMEDKTPLHMASFQGHVQVVAALLAHGADVDCTDKHGDPQLHPRPLVLESDHPYKNNLLEYIPIEIPGAHGYLLEFHTDTSFVSNHFITVYKDRGLTAHWGEEKYTGGYRGSARNFPGQEGRPALLVPALRFVVHVFSTHISFDWGYRLRVVPLFLNSEVKDENESSSDGWTPLMWAAYNGKTAAAACLLDAGADVETCGWDGSTPLSLAVRNFHLNVALLLMQRGGRLDRKNKFGMSPIEYAVRDGQTALISAVLSRFELFRESSDGGRQEQKCAKFVWHTILSQTENHLEDVTGVLDRLCGDLHELVQCRDDVGRRVIDVSRPVYKTAMMERLFFCKHYELREGPPEHKSTTSVVYFAKCYQVDAKTSDVALKFIADRQHFERELTIRTTAEFHQDFVVTILRTYSSDDDPAYKSEAVRKNMYPYCVVLAAAERNISTILTHEHIAGKDWDVLRSITLDVVKALHHIHSKGVIHGDVKLLNIVRCSGRHKFIDFDASVQVTDGQYSGAKYSSAYAPPELLVLVDGRVVVRSFPVDVVTGAPSVDRLPYALLPASFSYDMWSLGAVLFHLFAGEPLFKSNDEDNLDQGNLKILFDWSDNHKNDCLNKIPNVTAKNLVGRLLSKSPHLRPDTARVLAHPFLSGATAVRLVGEEAAYDVFLSYRVSADLAVAKLVYEHLQSLGLRVWWDKKSLEPGKNWEDGFCCGLVNSMVFLPLVSRSALFDTTTQNFCSLVSSSPCDNVLLEYRLAVELKEMGLIESIFPVFIGDSDNLDDICSSVFSRFHSFGAPLPSFSIDSVEAKVKMYLDRQGLGLPVHKDPSVQGVCVQIFQYSGVFLEGNCQDALSSLDVVNDIVNKRSTTLRQDSLSTQHCTDMQDELDCLILENDLLHQQQERLLAEVEKARSLYGDQMGCLRSLERSCLGSCSVS